MHDMKEIQLNADEYKARGNKLFQEKKYVEALANFESAIKLKSHFKEAWLNKGLAHKALQQIQPAIDAFRQALIIDPQYEKAQYQYNLLTNAFTSVTQQNTLAQNKLMTPKSVIAADNKPDAQIFYGIVDLKLMTNGKIKILEFGRGFASAFTGHDQLHPNETIEQMLRLALSSMKPNCVNTVYGNEEQIVAFFKTKQSSAQAMVNTKNIENYKGIIGGLEPVRTNPDILHMDNSVVWHIASRDKYITHLLFQDHQNKQNAIRPKCIALPVRYEPDLCKRIKDAIPGKRYVLKAPRLNEGNGVTIVNEDELDDYLKLLLFTTAEEFTKRMAEIILKLSCISKNNLAEKTDEIQSTVIAWRQSGCDVFLVEEYCPSKAVIFSQKSYDATMRVAYLIVINDGVAKFLPLGSFWDLPAKPIGEGKLREQTVSHIKSGEILTADVSEADQELVYAQLADCLPNIFLKMLSFNLLQEIQRLCSCADVQEKKYGDMLFLDYINTLSLLYHHEDANNLLKQIKKTSDKQTYYCYKGLFHSHKGELDKAITKLTRANQLNPKDSFTLFSRAQTYAKLRQPQKAFADLNSAKQLGFNSILIETEQAKLRIM